MAGSAAHLIDKPPTPLINSLQPMLKILLLILFRCLIQIPVLLILVIQIVAIKTFVTQMIAATRYAPKSP
jgi:hypothetical protein